MKKVSVIIAAYQVEDYLVRAVSSALNQTLSDIEIIIVDDGSTDQTSLICDELAKYYSQIRVIHQENKGLSEARKSGIAIATGDFLLFLDGDDWLKHNALETLYQIATTEEADLVIYYLASVVGEHAYLHPTFKESASELTNDPIGSFLNQKIAPSLVAKFIRRSYLIDNEIKLPDSISYAEDFATTSRLIMHHPKISTCTEPLYYYMIRSGSLVNTVSEKYLEIFKALDVLGTELIQRNCYQVYKEAYFSLASHYLNNIYQILEQDTVLKEKYNTAYQKWYQKYASKE